MKIVQKFEAFDGTSFDTEAECKSYEREHAGAQLVGLTGEQITAALARSDEAGIALAEAIEAVAYRIKKRRLENGDRKRRRSDEVEAERATVEAQKAKAAAELESREETIEETMGATLPDPTFPPV
jgi:hypothetical protein